jgi:hypothetical protein
MSDDVALSLVGPIKAAYDAAEKAGESALTSALECGKHLSSAKETVEKSRGKWKRWREKNLPGVSEETERVAAEWLGSEWRGKDASLAMCHAVKDSKNPQALEPRPPTPSAITQWIDEAPLKIWKEDFAGDGRKKG